MASYGFLGSNSFLFEPTNVFSLAPNIALVRGKHTIRGGLDFRLSRFTEQRPDFAASRLDFDRAFTRQNYLVQDAVSGNGIASLLLGYAASGRIDNNVFPYYQSVYAAPWIQDDFKVTRKLTLNLGLRWDMNFAPTERFNRANRARGVSSSRIVMATAAMIALHVESERRENHDPPVNTKLPGNAR